MNAVIQRRVLRARKAATCACGFAIKPGDIYGHTYANGRVTKACITCHAAIAQEDEHDEIMDDIGDRAFGANDGGDSWP